ncbi:MAG: L,D-transpeptidase, partial [Actinobacteria bacterium]|nr:L,D-transpeptidase [Actinomycetota bacterium]
RAAESAPRPPAETAEVAAVQTPACVAGTVRKVGSGKRSLAAIVRDHAVAFRTPGGERIADFGARNVNGVPTVFGVLARRVDARCRATWYRVQLPLRPNGIVGWVRARAVAIAPVTTRIEVDLSARRVTLFDAGRRVLVARAAIGSDATPTPTGSYYVNQRLIPTDTSGPFGPGAVGISAFSDVLTGWVQGGPIAIHGTNRPDLIGQAVSNGCIRLANADLRALFDRALAGTPVTVRA